jgi:hypothetical protein
MLKSTGQECQLLPGGGGEVVEAWYRVSYEPSSYGARPGGIVSCPVPWRKGATVEIELALLRGIRTFRELHLRAE